MREYLGVDRTTLQRLEARDDGKEPGSIGRLLDLLEADPSLMPPEPAGSRERAPEVTS